MILSKSKNVVLASSRSVRQKHWEQRPTQSNYRLCRSMPAFATLLETRMIFKFKKIDFAGLLFSALETSQLYVISTDFGPIP